MLLNFLDSLFASALETAAVSSIILLYTQYIVSRVVRAAAALVYSRTLCLIFRYDLTCTQCLSLLLVIAAVRGHPCVYIHGLIAGVAVA